MFPSIVGIPFFKYMSPDCFYDMSSVVVNEYLHQTAAPGIGYFYLVW